MNIVAVTQESAYDIDLCLKFLFVVVAINFFKYFFLFILTFFLLLSLYLIVVFLKFLHKFPNSIISC